MKIICRKSMYPENIARWGYWYCRYIKSDSIGWWFNPDKIREAFHTKL